MYRLVDVLVDTMSSHYGYLEERKEPIKSAMKLEEERFFDTIEAGITLFNKELANTKDVFSGEVAFKLYDTYGFPLDLTEDMLRELEIGLDRDEFEKHMAMQREQSKASWKGSGDALANGDFKELKESFGINNFVGYEHKNYKSKVLALLNEDFKITNEIKTSGWVMLDNTPFYAQSGGQRGDEGTLNDTVRVTDTKKFLDINLSHVEGKVKVGEFVEAIVDDVRAQIAKHHSATHLLHSALREILGGHIAQAGSLVEENRLRFDFSHPSALSNEELEMIEAWVNDKIDKAIVSITNVMDIQSAKDKGAMALFGEKYGEHVRVVEFSDSSIELCGGIHVENSSQIGQFIILKESGVSAGVRRIEAICGKEAINFTKNMRMQIEAIKTELKSQDPINGIVKLKEQVRTLKQQLEASLNSQKSELSIEEINGAYVAVSEVGSGDIKTMIDDFKNKYDKALIMLIQPKDDKVLIACGSKGTSIKAGEWIKNIAPILGGGGGGRDDFAQAGGKEASKISEAIQASKEYIKNNL
jgi:alanyl-tRNA synthetase